MPWDARVPETGYSGANDDLLRLSALPEDLGGEVHGDRFLMGATEVTGWPRGFLPDDSLPDQIVIWDHILKGPTIEYLTQVSRRCPLPVTWVVTDQVVIE